MRMLLHIVFVSTTQFTLVRSAVFKDCCARCAVLRAVKVLNENKTVFTVPNNTVDKDGKMNKKEEDYRLTVL